VLGGGRCEGIEEIANRVGAGEEIRGKRTAVCEQSAKQFLKAEIRQQQDDNTEGIVREERAESSLFAAVVVVNAPRAEIGETGIDGTIRHTEFPAETELPPRRRGGPGIGTEEREIVERAIPGAPAVLHRERRDFARRGATFEFADGVGCVHLRFPFFADFEGLA
jgi:hypothetical protein